MLNDAGHALELTDKDVDAYWRGRMYIEAARMEHEAQEDPTVNTMNYRAMAPHWQKAKMLVMQELKTHEGPLPDAVFEDGQTLEPRFVILLALLLDDEKLQVDGKTVQSMINLSQAARDKRIVLVLNKHDTELSRHLAVESGFDVLESGLVKMPEKMITKTPMGGYFELETIRDRKEPDLNLRAVRQSHNRAGKHQGHQRFNAKPQRQNFKGRGR